MARTGALAPTFSTQVSPFRCDAHAQVELAGGADREAKVGVGEDDILRLRGGFEFEGAAI